MMSMFARVTTFKSARDAVDGPIRFAVQRASEGMMELPGFLGLLDLSDRKSGEAVVVTLWATKEARDASVEFARNAAENVAEEGDEKVISVRDYEVGYSRFSDAFPAS
jgi:heme-degrading monooxygenase HmoA